ncbi:hypothetical protein ACHAWF_015093 [Thalassiosira exigua]
MRACQIGPGYLANRPGPPPTPVSDRGVYPGRERGLPRDCLARAHLEARQGDHGSKTQRCRTPRLPPWLTGPVGDRNSHSRSETRTSARVAIVTSAVRDFH